MRRVVMLAAIVCGAKMAYSVEVRFADRVSLHPIEPTEVTLTGNKLRSEHGEIAAIWTSFPADVEPVDNDNKDRNSVRYRITPSRPIGGIVALRAFDNESISQAMLFSVESLPISTCPAPADPPLKLPAVLDCSSQGLGDRSVAFDCAKGQRFVAEIVGARIGSEIDGLLILKDENQNELAFADDHPVTGSDPILQWTATYDGVHHLAVRDVEYRGGLRMQVRLTERSTAATCFPNVVRLGETRYVEQSVVASLGGEPKRLLAKGSAASGLTSLTQPSFLARLAQTDLPIYVERAGARNEMPTPAVFAGRIETADEQDAVFISASDEDSIVVEFLKCDSPFVGVVELRKEGNEVARQHFGSDPNGSLRYEVTEGGEYEIRIRDALGRSGLGYEYAMSVRNEWMPAVVRISPARKNKKRRNNLPHRQVWHAPETLPIYVHLDRRGYTGRCRIVADLDGHPCRVDGTIGEKRNESEVEVHLPESFQDRSQPEIAHLRIYGQATIDGNVITIPLDLRDHVSRDFPNMTVTPSIVGSEIAVLIKPAEKEETQ